MTREIRKTDKYIYIKDVFNNTIIIRVRDNKQTNWNTGYEAEEEKDFLVNCNEEVFNQYCKQVLDNR